MGIEFNFSEFWELIEYLKDGRKYSETIAPKPAPEFLNSKLESTLLDTQDISLNFFNNIIEQSIYYSTDWLRFKNLLLDWYTSYSFFMNVHKNISNPEYINKDLMLESFGYPYSSYHNDDVKKSLLLNYVSLLKGKGTPETLRDMLFFTTIQNLYFFEYWLVQDYTKIGTDSLNFVPEIVFAPADGSTINIDSLSKKYTDLFDKSTNTWFDPHWFYEAQDVLNLNSTSDITLPSMTPYYGLSFFVDWQASQKNITIKINRMLTDQYNEYIKT